jgi:hypothetical protein
MIGIKAPAPHHADVRVIAKTMVIANTLRAQRLESGLERV